MTIDLTARHGWRQRLAGVLLAGAASTAAAPTSAERLTCHDPSTLSFVQIPLKDAATQERQARPLVAYLEERLGRPVRRVVALSYGAVVEGLLAGSYDLAELGPASYASALNRGARLEAIAALSSVSGTLGYQSVLVVRSDRGYASLDALAGATLALTDPDSTSGSLLPRLHVPRLTGKPLRSHFGRVTFTGSHTRALQAVKRGLADAAFVSSVQVEHALRTGTLAPGELTELWRSNTLPPAPYVVRQDLCPALRQSIREALLAPAGALDGWLAVVERGGFVVVTDNDYQEVREAWRQAHPPEPPAPGSSAAAAPADTGTPGGSLTH